MTETVGGSWLPFWSARQWWDWLARRAPRYGSCDTGDIVGIVELLLGLEGISPPLSRPCQVACWLSSASRWESLLRLRLRDLWWLDLADLPDL